jgi:[ribosomal protein S18]-alanine N-acetyltransferase
MDKLDIFPINSSHLDEILEIEKLSFSSPWPKVSFDGEFSLPHSFSYGIRSTTDMKMRGYLFFWLLEEEIHILNLATHPALRRAGMAFQLISHLIDIASKAACKLIFLEVRPSNSAAIGLYESFGFVQVGIRPNYYSDTHEDALLYTLFIDEDGI